MSTEVSFDSLVVFGLQWEPLEFLGKALEVKHPVDLQEAFTILFKWWVVVGFHLLLLSASVFERRMKNKNQKTFPHLFSLSLKSWVGEFCPFDGNFSCFLPLFAFAFDTHPRKNFLLSFQWS